MSCFRSFLGVVVKLPWDELTGSQGEFIVNHAPASVSRPSAASTIFKSLLQNRFADQSQHP